MLAVLYALAGCRPKKENPYNITPRNTGINESNAYNNLFLDTAAVSRFIAQQHLNDTLASRLRSFYNARNFQYAWFDGNGLTEQAYGFRSLYDYSADSSESNRSLEYRLNALMNGDDSVKSAKDPDIVKTELQLTTRFIRYFLDTHAGAGISPRQLEHFVPIQKYPVLALADSVLADKSRDSRRFAAGNPHYGSLKEQLQKYTGIAKKGGWDSLPATPGKRYRRGDSAAVLAGIKKRLLLSGELEGNDTSALFNDALEAAVKRFEESRGHTPRGVITDTLIREMNLPAIALVQKLLINMERMRWMPPQPRRPADTGKHTRVCPARMERRKEGI